VHNLPALTLHVVSGTMHPRGIAEWSEPDLAMGSVGPSSLSSQGLGGARRGFFLSAAEDDETGAVSLQ